MVRLSVFFLCLAGLVPLSSAAQEPFEGKGYVIACGEEGCFVNASGFDLFVAQDQGAALLADLPMLSAVTVTGTLSEMGDSSAALALSGVERVVDDPYEGNLQALQGDWRPLGEDTPFVIGVYGMDWNEIILDEVQDRFMMSVGEACADGTVHRGMVVNLYRYGDDPGADGCWLLEYIDDARMTLRNVGGGGEVVDFVRQVE